MGKTLTNYYDQTVIHLKIEVGETTLSESEIKSHIQIGAMDIHSKLRPLELVVDGTGTNAYTYDLPEGWVDDFSRFLSIEYPTGNQEPSLLEKESYGVYKNTTENKLRFYEISPNATFRMRFTAMHSVPDSGDGTAALGDFDAICKLAASLGCGSLAVKFGQTTESVIGADAIGYTPKSSVYASRSKDLMKQYLDHMVGAQKAAVMIMEYDPGFTWNRDFLTHLPRWR